MKKDAVIFFFKEISNIKAKPPTQRWDNRNSVFRAREYQDFNL